MTDTLERKKQVLAEIKRHGNISRTARKVGISRQTIRYYQQTDKVFNQAFELAQMEGKA